MADLYELKRMGYSYDTYGGVIIGTKYDDYGYTEFQWDLVIRRGKIKRLEAELDPDTGQLYATATLPFTSFESMVSYLKEFNR